ncbi:DUF2812 domain-containing protein [Christensenellaceae bacterium OttesenSCG-928-L17]|nr:DUF2812 domain-containing protein [Christensenellaceae bacterium OttesenSCG-928-L17]
MIKKVFRLLYDYRREEAWLNQMAAQGWLFKSFFMGTFTFEQGTPGAYTYRVILLSDHYNAPESQSYLQFLGEMNVEVVDCWIRWAYLRKAVADGPLEVYTSVESQLMHYKRLRNWWIAFTCLEFVCFCMTLPVTIERIVGGMSPFPFILGNILLFFITLAMVRQVAKCSKQVTRLKQEQQLHE